MTVKSILDQKGRDVITIEPGATIREAAAILGTRRIGAIVVAGSDRVIKGILSERDVVRQVSADGGDALDKPVSVAMTKSVKTCGETNTINDVMSIMTQGRFRHLPVEVDGKLAGIISIGDVVKRRIEDVEREAEEIKAYIATA